MSLLSSTVVVLPDKFWNIHFNLNLCFDTALLSECCEIQIFGSFIYRDALAKK